MGRTIDTINGHLQAEEDGWKPVRRALRSREEKDRFDRMFTRIRLRAAEVSTACRPVPFDMLIVAWMLDVEEELERLRAEMEAPKKPDPTNATMDLFGKETDPPNVFMRKSDNIQS